jgi:hypothetical protein
MPPLLLGLICLAVLAVFIGYAFHQGMKVPPDRNNTNTGQAKMIIRPVLFEPTPLDKDERKSPAPGADTGSR